MGLKKKPIHHSFSDVPIDIRVIPDVFSFSHVKGIARIFLITEMTLSTLIVIGTVALLVLNTFVL